MEEAEQPLRRIRSFVRREGRFTPAQRDAFATLWSGRGLEITDQPVDLAAMFPACSRFTLEIGFGMGQSLAELASRDPQTGFIGVEVHRPGVGKLLALAEEHQLANLRIFCADAVEVLRRALPEASLDRVLLFFPDPWPKKRHNKRRIGQPEFVRLVHSRLKPGGIFHLATDWEPYAQHMLEVLDAAPGWRNLSGQGQFAERPDWRPLTRFEQRGQRLGHGVWDLLYECATAPD